MQSLNALGLETNQDMAQQVERTGGVSQNLTNHFSPVKAAKTKSQKYYERMKKSKDNAGRRIKIVSAVCLAFMTMEFIGGYFANSLAIMTDAAHLLSDFAGFMISLVAIWLATRPATKTMSFGWYRAEVMGAILSVLLIWVLTGVLVYLAIHRIITEDYEIDASIMLITASIGVIINVIMGAVLHHGHGHSHASGKTRKTKSPYKSPTRLVIVEQDSQQNVNVRAAFIHVVGDLLQSVGVFIAALLIWFKPSWAIADPICTFIFSVIVLITTLAILKDAFLVLMEAVPKGLNFNDLKAALGDIPGVMAVHDLHIWSLTVGTISLSVHLVIESEGYSSQAILEEASAICRECFDIHHNTIQVETHGEKTTECSQCQDPVGD